MKNIVLFNVQVTRQFAIWSGILTLLPFGLIFLLFWDFTYFLEHSLESKIADLFDVCSVDLHIIEVIGYLASGGFAIVFLIYIFGTLFNTKINPVYRVIWVISHFCFHIFSFAIYWYLYLWKPANKSLKPGTPGTGAP